jgi:aerobic carbon-monoxide dehydrogenase small subunit
MKIALNVNGTPVSLDVDPTRRLLTILNDELRLSGARAACGIGRCGACVVLVDGQPMNACLVLAGKLDHADVMTIEGLGPRADAVRHALAEAGAVQCGYCSPGLVLTLNYLAEQNLLTDLESTKALLCGQICRCTGYGGLKRALAALGSTTRSG